MSWSLRDKLRRDFVALLPSSCQMTSEHVHPRQIRNNRTESFTLKQSRMLCVRDIILAVVVIATLNTSSTNLCGQDGLVPLRLLTDGESSSTQPSSLAADFADRLEKNQIKTEREKLKSNDEDESKPGEIELLGYMTSDSNETKDPADGEKASASLAAEFAKRLSDVEKQLKKRDEADAKKANTYPTHKITGFLQVDTAFYSQTPRNIATVGDAQDGTGFRRARFAVNGKVAQFTNYQLEVDFAAAGRPSFFDNYVEQGNLPILGDVRVGQFLQPFSVDAMSGFRNLAFLERSLPFLAFVPFRRVGIMSSNATDDDMTHWAYSVFRTGGFNNAPLGDSRFATDFGNVGGYSFSTRLTHLLYYDEFAKDRCLWHIGFSYNFSELGADDATGAGVNGNAGTPKPFYQSRTTPEFFLGYPENNTTFDTAVNGTPIFVDTGKYQAKNFNLMGLETVYQNGPLSLQSEYMATVVESVVGPVFYQGAYGEVMYRLTGEHRGYDKKLASFKNPIPYADFLPLKWDGVRGWGAWGLAARWSVVDLTNPSKLDGHYYNSNTNSFNTTSKAGNGVLNDFTFGVNWYMNQHTKLQFNWIHAMLDNTKKGNSTAELFVTRMQVDF